MQLKLDSATNESLKCRAVELLAYGALPYEQWANVFANPSFVQWPGLQAKAFAVWFPTMLDFLKGAEEAAALEKELAHRKVGTEGVFELIAALSSCYENVLALYSTEDQIFLRDRRLQNVHGRLHINVYEEHHIDVYDGQAKKIAAIVLPADKYRALMTTYYSDLSTNSKTLLDRLLNSHEFVRLTKLYVERLRFADHFQALLEKLGVNAAAGSGTEAAG